MKKFNVAVVGCGWAAGVWVDYALTRDDVEFKLLVDINIDAANELRKSKNLSCEVARKLDRDIIERLGVNLVFDTTIPDAHFETVTTALKAGCDVFGEKPMSSSLEQARKMVEIAKETGRTYSIMQNYRYNRGIRGFKELLSPEIIGDLGTLHADFFLNPNFSGFRAEMESPLILDMAIHSFDEARFLSGADAVSVYCHEYNPSWSYYKGDISAVVIFEMSNGAVFSYHGSWAAPGFNTSWNCNWRAVGSKGTALWNGGWESQAEVYRNGEFVRVEPKFTWDHTLENQPACLAAMFKALKEGYEAETICTDNIKSIEMVFAAIESSRTGKKVWLK
ncbi:MAG TPA: Gfo/Idh/MocA family oxidoreductase [Clostridiales bacterium]|nr:Gfo/Idh/MocA family oxidoreductase [Clostridiales bacterium]